MRGAAPLLGAVTGLAHQSCSRIPHLRVHILSRQSRTKLSRNATTQTTQRRYRSTFISLDLPILDHSDPLEISNLEKSSSHRSSRADRKTAEATEVRTRQDEQRRQDAADGFSFSCNNVQELDFPAKHAQASLEESAPDVFEIIQEGHPDRVLFALLDPLVGHNFIRDVDDLVFEQAFCLLSPKHFIGPYRDAFRFIKPGQLISVRPLEKRFDSFAASLNAIMNAREISGHNLTLPVYRHLLDCARMMGDGSMAKHVFDVLMPGAGIKPDLQSYNFYMEAVCWSKTYTDYERFRLRVTHRQLELRGSDHPPPDLSGHRVARDWHPPERKQLGIRLHTLNKFKELVSQGFQGDESTFVNLMTAMGREGRLDDVKSILKSVWNIDVDLLGAYDEEEIESPTFYEENSPLRPTSRLLYAVAHTFGSNNNVGLAFSLVDYISRNYNIEVPHYIWQQLCEWTLILSLKRSGKMVKQGQDTGKVDRKVFIALWEAMTDKPHNVVPDVILHVIHATLRMDVLNFNMTLHHLREARSLLETERVNLQTLTSRMLDMVKELLQEGQQDGILTSAFLDTRQQFLLWSLAVERDRLLLSIALRRFFTRAGWRYRTLWERIRRPELMEEFAEFLPNSIRFTLLRGSVVELDTKETREQILRTGQFLMPVRSYVADDTRTTWGPHIARAQLLRAALDTDDHAELIRNTQLLPEILESGEWKWCFNCGDAGHWRSACPHHISRSGGSGHSAGRE